MMSTASMSPVFLTDPCPVNQFSAFATGISPWDSSDLYSMIHSPDETVELKPIFEEPDLEEYKNRSDSGFGYEEKTDNLAGSGDNTGKRRVTDLEIADERRKKRKISNRESARRSRMRKQRHEDKVRGQLYRFRNENRALTNRIRFLLYHVKRVRTENDRLRMEHGVLQQKLMNIQQIMMLRQIQRYSTFNHNTFSD